MSKETAISKNQQPQHGVVYSINVAVWRPLVGAAGAAVDSDDPPAAGSVRIVCFNVVSQSRVPGVGDVAALLTDGLTFISLPLVAD